jgi:hypothetical protein
MNQGDAERARDNCTAAVNVSKLLAVYLKPCCRPTRRRSKTC